MKTYNLTGSIYELSDFLVEKYLKEYIHEGGSKIKFITGKEGSGKSYFLNIIAQEAHKLNYKVVKFSASKVYLNDFKEIYCEILRQCDIEECLYLASKTTIRNLGYNPDDILDGYTLIDYLSIIGNNNPITKRAIRDELKNMFLNNPYMDNNFALASSMVVASYLGHPTLENTDKEIIKQWFFGAKELKMATIKNIGLAPVKITKLNARHMLRSLLEIIKYAGYQGLVVLIDDLEIVLNKSGLNEIHYTKTKREDMYESIRQIIDDIDSFKNTMFFFSFDKELIDAPKYGIQSYQALWTRIQSEIVENRFNRFSDILDLDRFATQFYSEDVLENMYKEIINKLVSERDIESIHLSKEDIAQLKERKENGSIGMPELLFKKAFNKMKKDEGNN